MGLIIIYYVVLVYAKMVVHRHVCIVFFVKSTNSNDLNYPFVSLHNGSLKSSLLVDLIRIQYRRDDEPTIFA